MIRDQARITETHTKGETIIRLVKCIDDTVLFEAVIPAYSWGLLAARTDAWRKARELRLEVVE